MLIFMISMNQELKGGKENRAQHDKMVDFLMMKGVRPSSSKKVSQRKHAKNFSRNWQGKKND